MSSNKPGDSRPCVSCLLTPEMDRLITAQAERSGVSRAAVVRGVLERYFEQLGMERACAKTTESI